ncbi:hypothetical protein XELAEV_18024967mg, partial [Xenopus laevis]
NQILHFTSQHPPHTKKSIPISQLSRVQRLVSEGKEKEKQEQIMCHKFRERGYPEKVIQQAQQRVRHPKGKTKQMQRVPFVTQFHNNSDAIGKLLRKHWYILRNAYPTIPEFRAPPLISYRKGKTIGAHVTSTLVKTKPKEAHTFWGGRYKGMYPCLSCVQCPFILKGREFVHPQTGQQIQLRGHFTCISKFAIYVLTCPCGLIYVGETTQMVKSRISQHRSSINLGNTTLPVSKHLVDLGHTADQLKFMVLEVVPPMRRGGDRELKLKRREVWWINMLKSLYPRGLNRDCDLFLFL